MTISVIELFAGIGAPRKALIRAGIPHKVIGISEIDKFAIQSYNALYGDVYNFGDIKEIKRLPYADLWVYGSPCQDWSCSGKQLGLNGNRSVLLLEVKRLLEKSIKDNIAPKYLLLENVKNLIGKKFKTHFDDWVKYLDRLGYNTYWQVLNATDFNVPQNRERVFAISIRKDIDNNLFKFPIGNGLSRRIKDIIEENADEKYYLNKDMQDRFFDRFNPDNTNNTDLLIKLGNCSQDHTSQAGCVYSVEGVSPTLTAGTHGYAMGNILEPIIVASRGRYAENGKIIQNLEPNLTGCANTLTTVQKDNLLYYKFRVRRLTPLECIRLMGFDDEDYKALKAINMSDTQIYKQCGNSIVVNVLEEIFKNLLTE